MTQQLSELRVSADLDASKYVAGAQQKVAADKEMAASSTAAGAAVTQTASKISQAGDVLAKLSRQYVDGYATAQRFNAALGALGRGMETGRITATQAAPILDGIYKKYGMLADATAIASDGQIGLAKVVASANATFERSAVTIGKITPAVNDNARAMSLNRIQQMEALHVGRELVTMWATGIPIEQAFGMEAGRIATFFQVGEGGFSGTLKATGSAILGFITPLTVGVTALAAFGGAALYAYKSFEDGQQELRRSLQGFGAAAGVTTSQLEKLSEQAARTSHITVGSARDIVSAFVSTGTVKPGQLSDFTDLTKRYADLFGGSYSSAGASLAKIFADPAKGASELEKQIGHLDAATLEYIRHLEAGNHTSEAQRVLFDAVNSRLENMESHVGTLTRLWDGFKNAVSGAATTLGNIFDPSLETRLANAQSALAALEQQRKINQQFPIANLGSLFPGQNPAADTDKQIDAYKKLIAGLQAQATKAQADAEMRARQEQAAALSQKASSIVNGANPDILDRAHLQERLDILGQSLTRQATLPPEVVQRGLGGLTPDQVAALPRAYDLAKHALDTWISSDERMRQSNELSIRSINARTVAEKAQIAAEEKALANRGKEMTPEADRLSQAAVKQQVFAQATRAANDALIQSQDAMKTAGLSGYAKALAEINAQIEKQIKLNPENAATWNQVRQAQIAALQANTVGPINDNIAFQRSQMFRSSGDQQIAAALRGTGLGLDSPQAQAMRQNVEIGQIRGTLDTFFSTFQSEAGKQGTSIGKAVMDGFRQAALSVANNLAKSFFDQISGWATQSISKMFGLGGSPATGMPGASTAVGSVGTAVAGAFAAPASSVASAVTRGGIPAVSTVADYIRQAASARGIDPSIALRVARSEGLGQGIWQSNYTKDGIREPSFGPFQLLKGGPGTGFPTGLGNQFMAQTGLNPADPATWRQNVDFSLNHAVTNGWGDWYGAAKAGVGNYAGLQGASTQAVSALDKLATSSTSTAQTLTSGLGKLGQGLSSLPATPTASGGGGLFGWLGSLFSPGISSGVMSKIASSAGGLYDTGGFTGYGGVHQPAGIVHKGEVVWSQSDIRRAGGVGVVEGMRRGFPGYADGGLVRGYGAANINHPVASNSNSPVELNVHVHGASGDDHVRTLVNQGVSTALDGYNKAQKRGGVSQNSTFYSKLKG